MIPEDKLLAWFMVMQYNFAQEGCDDFHVPTDVKEEFMRVGWYEIDEETRWNGTHNGSLTPKGRAIVDMHGPEWGLDTIPEETEA